MSSYFNTHVHSHFSTIDGMSTVPSLVERAAKYNQPGMFLTDHGNGAGWVQLYNSCKKNGILPFPGIEAYIIDPAFDSTALGGPEILEASRYHLIIAALDLKGYQGLVRLSTLSFSRPRFHKFPRLLVDDLVEFGNEYGEHVVVTTGCYFGLVQRTFWEKGWDATNGVVRQLKASFPHLFVELHNHAIPDGFNEMNETQLTSMLLKVADEHSLPLLAGADSHYLDQKQESAHRLMKRMVYGGAEDEFPGDTYHLPSSGWMQEKFAPNVWSRIEHSCARLVELNQLAIPQLDQYKVYVPKMDENADRVLAEKAGEALRNYRKADGLQEYPARLQHELDVIKQTKTADYFLLVNQIVEHVKSLRIAIEARGSANGSLLCFLLGITQIDPIKYGTSFRRFMAPDRIEPPDIDIDIADDKRHIVLEYLNNLVINGVKYKTSQIGTFSKFGQRDDDPNDTGSAFNQYIGSLRRKHMERAWEEEKAKAEKEGRKAVKARADEKGAISFNMSDDCKIKKLEDVKRIHPADYDGLKEIIEMNSVYKSKGTHAGGILISSEETKIEDFIPLMMIPKERDKGTWVTQYTMNDLKYLGLLKMDWLGQTSLTVMSKCMEFLGRDPLDFTWIPEDDQQVLKYVHSRKAHIGLFHLEQYPKSVAMTELKAKNTMDFVVWQAYSMPGATDSGAKEIYLKRRNSKNFKPDYEHPILHDVFDETLSVMLYQDQVLDVCRAIGMDGPELTNFFTIVKDSGTGAVERNRIRLNQEKPRFAELALEAGLTEKEIEWVWHQIIAMGGYAFGKGHSAGYGVRSYRTCYLKYYHPTEYMAALLYCWAGKNTLHNKRLKIKKDEAYLKEAINMNLRILPVRVNQSGANWSVDKERRGIRKGFRSVKGIGPAVAPRIEENGPYDNLKEFLEKTRIAGARPYLEAVAKNKPIPPATGVLKSLEDLGVLTF